jgi:acetyltransferase-like isoleucine patch superfamily enzyme
MIGRYFRLLWKLTQSPRAFFSLIKAVLLGFFYIGWFRITQRNAVIKFPFLCHAKVEISGPGKVFIDRGCSVWMNTFEQLVIQTLSPEAEVRIGKNCTLGGLTIRCRGKVFIGDNVLTAANLIQDVMIVSRAPSSSTEDYPESASSIRIGNNVWLGGQSLVLAGSSLGDGSVVGVNGLIYHTAVKDNCLVAGNPAMRPVPIDKVVKLQGSPG